MINEQATSGFVLDTARIAADTLAADIRKARPVSTGTIIAWSSVSSSGVRYAYTAVFASGHWYTSLEKSNQHLRPKVTHEELLAYFRERGDHLADLRVATEFVSVSM